MTRLAVVACLVAFSSQPLAPQPENRRSCWVGAVLYTQCQGQPPIPDPGSRRPRSSVSTGDTGLLASSATGPASAAVRAVRQLPPVPPDFVDGEWWLALREREKAGDVTAATLLPTFVLGVLRGADGMLMASTETYADYRAVRSGYLADGLTINAVMLKLDAYYLDPAHRTIGVANAALGFMKPAKP